MIHKPAGGVTPPWEYGSNLGPKARALKYCEVKPYVPVGNPKTNYQVLLRVPRLQLLPITSEECDQNWKKYVGKGQEVHQYYILNSVCPTSIKNAKFGMRLLRNRIRSKEN